MKKEIVEESFEEILYTRIVKERNKKRTITKKVGRKHEKTKKKVKDGQKDKEKLDMDNENRNEKDISISEGVDTQSTNEKRNKKKKQATWIKPRRNPTRKEERRMFGKALEIMLITCMDNHIYQFENKIRIQSHGGPIGLKLTGEIADCLMIDWDKKLLEKLKSFKMIPDLYTRFKDDIEIAIDSLEKGSILLEDKIVVDENRKLIDENKTESKITMDIAQQIANRVNPG